MLLLNAIPLTSLVIVLFVTTIDVGTATESSTIPEVGFTPASGSPVTLFLPKWFPSTTTPPRSCCGAWLWKEKPPLPLPFAVLSTKWLLYEAVPGVGAASSSPAPPLFDETLCVIVLSYTPANFG